MKNSLIRLTLYSLIGIVTVVLMACTPTLEQSPAEPATGVAEAAPAEQSGEIELSGDLTDLNSIETFKTIFNQDAGKPRLILLMSPT